MKIKRYIVLSLITVSTVIFLISCTKNQPWRTSKIDTECNSVESCQGLYIEQHQDYALAFVEYSERGNLFDLDRTEDVYRYLKDKSDNGGVAIIVFIHGWKHNAKSNDTNVINFRQALKTVKPHFGSSPYNLVGVYVGWRGESIKTPLVRQITYWDRKTVAEEVGKGGMTDLLSKLEQINQLDGANILLVVGHSFGGAITVAGLNEILLSRLNDAEALIDNEENHPLSTNGDNYLKAFGNSVIVLNPAIEANQLLQLKEQSMSLGQKCVDETTAACQPIDFPTVLHVISSQGDNATNIAFPIGQFLGTSLKWDETEFKRTYRSLAGERDYWLSEYDLDITTIGNYQYFHTGSIFLSKHDDTIKELPDVSTKPQFLPEPGDELADWEYKSYCGELSAEYFPCSDNEPVSFLITEKSFINDHNDIFNINVISYISTVISESIYRKNNSIAYPQCREKGGDFSFKNCFNYHYETYKN